MVKVTISNGEDTMTKKADVVVAITMSSTPVSDIKERTNVNAMMVGEAAPKTVFPVLAFTLGQLARDIIEDKNKLAKVASQMHVQLMEGLTGGSSVLDLTDKAETDSDEDPEDIEDSINLDTRSRGWRTR